MKLMKVLGIETSFDETSTGVIEITEDDRCILHSNVVNSSADLHAFYGGVVPEIAARSHIEVINAVIEQALHEAKADWDDIDAIAVTYGAGLGGSLLIGVLAARTLAICKKKPLYAINHVEAHLYANFIEAAVPHLATTFQFPAHVPVFPILGLIVSGAHSQLVLFKDHFDYVLLGQTQDDAIGEAFDKVAKLLGMPYPGGVNVEKLAATGNPRAFALPKAKMTSISPALSALRAQLAGDEQFAKYSYDYSFSGIKTAVLRLAQAQIGEDFTFPSTQLAARLSDRQKADIAASFQRVALETIVDKTYTAFQEFKPATVIIGGGVASSPALRAMLAERLPIAIEYADRKLCTDNGAMIAALGCFKRKLNQPTADPYTLDIKPNLSM